MDAEADLLLVHVVTRRAAEPKPPRRRAEAVTQPEVIKPERKEKDKED